MATLSGAYSTLRGVQQTVRDIGRMREILRIMARHGFAAYVQRMELRDEIEGVEADAGVDTSPESRWRNLREALEDLGPTFIKLGQIASTRSDILPAELLEELQHLQSNVPAMAWRDVQAKVERELGRPVGEAFQSFEQTPIAAASIAQAHFATLHDGSRVVVKVKRPGIHRKIDSDLSILAFLARRAEQLIPELQLTDPVGMVGEFDRALRKELDFNTEQSHIMHFNRSLKHTKNVRVPRVFPEYSARGVLTMTYIEGVKITEAPQKFGLDPRELMRTAFDILFQTILIDGFFHGDMHPGNILVDEKGSIGLIDFGLCGRYTPEQRELAITLLVGWIRADHAMMARAIYDGAIKVPGAKYDLNAIEETITTNLDKHLGGKSLNDVQVGEVFADLVRDGLRHNLRLPPEYTMVFKAIATMEGVGKTLVPDLDLMKESTPYVTRALREMYSPKRLAAEGTRNLSHLLNVLRKGPALLNSIVKEAEKGEYARAVELKNMNLFLQHAERNSRRVSRAVLCAGLMIAGAMVLDSGPEVSFGLNMAALVFFILAGLIARPFIWMLFTKD